MHEGGEVLKPMSITVDLQRKYGVLVAYNVAIWARNKGIEMIYNIHEKSFYLLPNYLHML